MNAAHPHFVLAHGFTQTARSWASLQDLLTDRLGQITTTAIDLPGHGGAALVQRDLWGAADHLVTLGGHGIYVGYSMGGRICLHAALAHSASVERLVLVGATAGLDSDADRAARRSADNELADTILEIGVPAFIDRWLMNPLFDGLTEETDHRDDRLRNTAEGLASSLQTCGTGTQQPLWTRLNEISVPTLVLVGERDEKFRAIGERLVASLPNGQIAVVPGAGHSVHLEKPHETADVIAAFVDDDPTPA